MQSSDGLSSTIITPGETDNTTDTEETNQIHSEQAKNVQSGGHNLPKNKASFIRLPNVKSQTASSGLVNVVREQAESFKAIHITPPQEVAQQNDVNVTDKNQDAAKETLSENPSETEDTQSKEIAKKESFIQPDLHEVNNESDSGLPEKNPRSTVKGADSFLQHLHSKKPILSSGLGSKDFSNGTRISSVDARTKIGPSSIMSVHNTIDNTTVADNEMKTNSIQNGVNKKPSIVKHTTGQSKTPLLSNNKQTKTSTRAEFFAAKLHDAIKDDEINRSDSEEKFVYDTAPQKPKPLDDTLKSGPTTDSAIPSPLDTRQNSVSTVGNGSRSDKPASEVMTQSIRHNDLASVISAATYSLKGRRSSSHSQQGQVKQAYSSQMSLQPSQAQITQPSSSMLPAGSKAASQISPALPPAMQRSPSRGQKSLEKLFGASSAISAMSDAGDAYSRISSTSSQKIKPQHHQLREITSRIFDSKGLKPRKYSGVDGQVFDHDEEEDETEAHTQVQTESTVPTNSTLCESNGRPIIGKTNGLSPIPSSVDYDSDIENDYAITDETKDAFRSSGPYSSYGTFNVMNHPYGNSAGQTYPGFDDPREHEMQRQLLLNREDGTIRSKHFGRHVKRKKDNIYFNPHDFTSARTRRIKQIKNFCYTIGVIFLLLSVGFIGGFILATSKELQSVQVSNVKDVLISDEEFVFNMQVSAFNPGVTSITVNDVQLDVFAKTKFIVDEYVYGSESAKKKKGKSGTDRYTTILLGSIDNLDIPLHFQGGCFTRKQDKSTTEIKILNPCSFQDDDDDDDGDNDDDNYSVFDEKQVANRGLSNVAFEEEEQPPDIRKPSPKWYNISRNPFDLIVRGVLNYQLLFSGENRTVSLNFQTPINPDDLP